MDIEVQKLIILFIFQLSLLCTLESLARNEGVIYVWHWQQLWCITLTVHGRRPRQLWAHDRELRQLFLKKIKTYLDHLMQGI